MLLNIPNTITIARVASIPLFIALVLWETWLGTILAIVLFALAAISDIVDGYLARGLGHTTTFGTFADPIADKLLITAALITFIQIGELTAIPVVIIISREFIVTGLRIMAISKQKVIPASILGKLKTHSHIGLILIVLISRHVDLFGISEEITYAFIILAVALALISAGEYFYRSRHLNLFQ
ncbi:CDP-diacylglycerol--glycerol-3-phosphate 3-phosphatidyltransferase [Candidatus Acetothermia bacterium]|jgi:CDP-diacylglycerol--glycerol-3-phosphate 3-phosphatidyltransferase|nr:CDP-diacylglycerol--glycerol-3-phosphate 3-phosphatidyltransferase [Candidatus Acetothermia bacterium]MCI2427885.1 CDP-diacylglycerol--glycerol-3-phosphate 3-phosphatidyltransferase [Candidatus Acetothermia bacterium]MCI2428900.1 CDP-diacylglycerol--glycerol-3-phosphate 3-phosphatidyltransferase [Candidatus Acetothermia bacterium]